MKRAVLAVALTASLAAALPAWAQTGKVELGHNASLNGLRLLALKKI